MIDTYRDQLGELIAGGWGPFGWRASDEQAAPSVAAVRFLERAEQYFSAAQNQKLPDLKRAAFDWPRYALLFHSIEMALKSYLLSQNVPMPRVKRIGRSLQRLERRAELRGLRLTIPTVQCIREMSKARFDDHPRDPGPEGAKCLDFVAAAAEVLKTTEGFVRHPKKI
jgi:HEPN domain-containing protein